MDYLRLPKADYFRKRYAEAIKNKQEQKAEYYRKRLAQMFEGTKVHKSGLTRNEPVKGFVFYSI